MVIYHFLGVTLDVVSFFSEEIINLKAIFKTSIHLYGNMNQVQMQKQQLEKFWKENGIVSSERVLEAFFEVPREEFVNPMLRAQAYDDTPLPLLRGKTISQPSTVMIMTQALEVEPGNIVFEIGSGSGYQTALLAKLVGPKGHVYTTEIIPELVKFARDNIRRCGLTNVTVTEADGSQGLPDKGPFDRIIITAASPNFPAPLVEQLKENGLIVGPVGQKDEQEMVRGTKEKDGKLGLEFLGQFLFTPLIGKFGFED